MMDEKAVLAVVDEGDVEALDLLLTHCPKAYRKFHDLTKKLHQLNVEIREVFPDAQYYSANGTVNLMLGAPHNFKTQAIQQQLVAATAEGLNVGGGDW